MATLSAEWSRSGDGPEQSGGRSSDVMPCELVEASLYETKKKTDGPSPWQRKLQMRPKVD